MFVFVLQQFKIFEMEVNSAPLVYLAVSSSLRLHLLSLLCAQHTQIHAVNMIQDIGQINTNTKSIYINVNRNTTNLDINLDTNTNTNTDVECVWRLEVQS